MDYSVRLLLLPPYLASVADAHCGLNKGVSRARSISLVRARCRPQVVERPHRECEVFLQEGLSSWD